MAIEERRSATRVALPEPLDATIGTASGRLVEVSASGVRVEHDERLVVFSETTLTFSWQRRKVTLPVKVARSEIAGRRDARLFYQSGLQIDPSATSNETLGELISWAMTGGDAPARLAEGETAWPRLERADTAGSPSAKAAVVLSEQVTAPTEKIALAPAPARAQQSPIPAATFGSNPFMSGADEDESGFICCTLDGDGWHRAYVDSPEHPGEGFTVPMAKRADVDGLMHSYQVADPDTRRMIRAAIR